MTLVTRRSQCSGKNHTLDLPVTEQQLADWDKGRKDGTAPHVQFAFPELNADQREFLLTGITPEEWDNLFGAGK